MVTKLNTTQIKFSVTYGCQDYDHDVYKISNSLDNYEKKKLWANNFREILIQVQLGGNSYVATPTHLLTSIALIQPPVNMVTSSNENISCVTGPLWGEFTGYQWIPLTKASDAELWCFLWSSPEQAVE